MLGEENWLSFGLAAVGLETWVRQNQEWTGDALEDTATGRGPALVIKSSDDLECDKSIE